MKLTSSDLDEDYQQAESKAVEGSQIQVKLAEASGALQLNKSVVWLSLGLSLFFGTAALIFYLGYLSSKAPKFGDNAYVFHLIAHSHDDLGWLVTEQEYEDLLVSHILRSSSTYLAGDPRTKFSFCNIGFLKHWIDSDYKNSQLFKKVVDSGQMEILNGGFAVHDNAATYFDDIINTYEYGREFVFKQFGLIPRTGWLIDPFGLSLTTSRLYSEMGYDQYVTNRIADWDRDDMRNRGQLQKNWVIPGKPEYNLFISEMADHYQTVDPLDIDFSLGSPKNELPIIDILDAGFNLDSKMQTYTNNIQNYISWFPTKNVMIPWGGDFYFKGFHRTIKSYNTIVDFMQSNAYTGRYNNFTFKVSSAQAYFEAVRKEKQLTDFVNKTGDFFPYVQSDPADPSHFSWTGYFTSTPYTKKAIRSFGEAARGLKNLLTMWLLRGEVDDIYVDEITSQADRSMWVVGINTHHDTITGTSKKRVAESYLSVTEDQTDRLNSTFNLFVSKYFNNSDVYAFTQYLELQNPYREGPMIEEESPFLFVSQGGQQMKAVRVRSSMFRSVSVINMNSSQHLRVVSSCNHQQVCEHTFFDSFLTAQGKFYLITENPTPSFVEHPIEEAVVYQEVVAGTNVSFSIKDGLISFSDGTQAFKFGLFYYGWSHQSNISRAYNGKYMFAASFPAELLPMDRGLAKYITQVAKDSLDILVSFNNSMWSVNFKYLPLAPDTHRYSTRIDCGTLSDGTTPDQVNYVVRYFSDIRNFNGSFTTDSNGLEKLTRFFGEKSQTIDINYFPLTRFIYLQDDSRRMTVMLDRAQGGTSPQQGVLEVMVNRRTLTDDSKGAEEGIDEGVAISVLHYLVFDAVKADRQFFRQHQVESDNPLIIYKADSAGSVGISSYGLSGVPGVDNPLVRVLFDRRADGRMMMRIYNMDEINSFDCDLLDMLRNQYQIKARTISETGIDFNFKTESMNGWTYNWNKRQFPVWKAGKLTLKPLQIRTFEISV